MLNFMAILSLYFPIFLSLSISFLLHTFKKHVHYFLHLATTFITTNNNKLCLKRHHPISSTTMINASEALNGSSNIGFVGDVGGDGVFMSCTESIGFESIEETHDQIMNKIDFDDDDDCKNDQMDDGGDGVEEGRGKVKSFPPPLSSLNRNGEQSFVLLPLRENGRLQLRKVRVRRPKSLYASREDGRLRMYLISDDDYDEEESEVEEEEEEEEQEVVEEEQTEEETIVESEVINEEIRCESENSKEEHRFEEWKFPTRRCHDVVNQSYNNVHLHMCIA